MTRPGAFAPILLAACAALSVAFADPVKNGFDLKNASVPDSLVLQGGPPRDGIPAIDEPAFESADEASWLKNDDRVIGVSRGGLARAYPIRILNWHEIVNDSFDGDPVLVTFCPLCGTGIVFEPKGGARADFGVSGLLYNSDVLLYDRETESLWSQILAEAVAGPRVGETLKVLPSSHTTWGAWRADNPGSIVLSRETGFFRDYDRDPYAGYERSPSIFFPVANAVEEGGLHPKERVMGLRVGDLAKAYPYSVLASRDEAMFSDTVGDDDFVIHWDKDKQVAWATDDSGTVVTTTEGFWFAWYAFFPETEVLP